MERCKGDDRYHCIKQLFEETTRECLHSILVNEVAERGAYCAYTLDSVLPGPDGGVVGLATSCHEMAPVGTLGPGIREYLEENGVKKNKSWEITEALENVFDGKASWRLEGLESMLRQEIPDFSWPDFFEELPSFCYKVGSEE